MDYSDSTSKRRKRRHNPHATRIRNTVGVLIFRVIFALLLIGGFAVAGAGIGFYLGILRNAPIINVQTDIRPGIYNSFIIEARTGREIARLSGEENREFASIGQMPQHLLDAFIAIEDERFLSHNGIDPRGMVRALHNNLTNTDGRTEGASTITQQLIKNMLGLTRNDLQSKLQEQYLAVQFERALTEQHGSREIAKEIILEAYLNTINLGRNWHGVQVAAWNYFGKDVSELTISESAVIAAITRHPSRYLPDRFPENNRYRQLLVLDNMLRLEMISDIQHRMAVTDPVHDRVLTQQINDMASGVVHTYFVDALLTQVAEDLAEQHHLTPQQANSWIFGGGLRIYATQDLRIQDIVDDVFLDDTMFPVDVFSIDIEYTLSARNEITGQTVHHRRTGTIRNRDEKQAWIDAVHAELLTANDVIVDYRYILMPQPQSAFVIMDQYNGHVLAISGGRGEKQAGRTFCRATVATRSPGSQFKVVAAFLPGIDAGIFSAATHFVDAPFTHDDGHTTWTPRNWWGASWRGPMSVRRAIYDSANVVSSIAFQEVGAERAFHYLTNLGFTTLEGTLASGRTFRDVGASVPLGGLTLGVTQLELAASYATIANLGEYNRPVFYTRVLDQNGRVLLENGHNPRRVISAQTAYILTDTMRDTVTRGTGTNARFRNVRGIPIAGKTGTSQNTEDLGFTGYTPYFTATVWLGFDRPRELPRGARGHHLTIWREIMERVHYELELEPRDFVRPDGITTVSLCRVTGLLPTDACRRAGTVVSDLAVAGFSPPGGHCDGHRETWLCVLSGGPIGEYCPANYWIHGIAPFGAPDICPYHGPHSMESVPPGGGFWGFPDLPGLPNQNAPGDGFWGFTPQYPGDQLPPQDPFPDPDPDFPWGDTLPPDDPPTLWDPPTGDTQQNVDPPMTPLDPPAGDSDHFTEPESMAPDIADDLPGWF